MPSYSAESHRMLFEAYGEHALGKTQCFEWFKKFKSGNFDVRNEDRGKSPKMFEDWDQKGVIYYELLKPGETVNTNRYQQQISPEPFWEKRHRRTRHKSQGTLDFPIVLRLPHLQTRGYTPEVLCIHALMIPVE